MLGSLAGHGTAGPDTKQQLKQTKLMHDPLQYRDMRCTSRIEVLQEEKNAKLCL